MSTLAVQTRITPPPIRGARSGAPPLVSVVIPCLNEADNIERVRHRRAATRSCQAWAYSGEVVVADNNSDDDSVSAR